MTEIVRIDLHHEGGEYQYEVTLDGDPLYADGGFTSVVNALVAAVEGMAPEVRAAEVACGGVVSGTYPLHTLAGNAGEVAEHAVNTTAAVWEATRD